MPGMKILRLEHRSRVMKGRKVSVERKVGECFRTPTQTDGRKPHRNDSLSRARIERQKHFLQGKCMESSCDLWHPPVCLKYKCESRCKCGDRCHFKYTEAHGQPSKKSKKSGRKGSVAIVRVNKRLGCVSQDSPQKKFFLREVGKLGSNRAVKFSKTTVRHA